MRLPTESTTLRVLRISQRILRSVVSHMQAVQSSLFMGLIRDEEFQRFDTYPFADDRPEDLRPTALAGLELWERTALERHFQEARTVLLVAAGGCREWLGLHELGFEVRGVEFSPTLTSWSNGLLSDLDHDRRITAAERFELPRADAPADAAFIGRKFYSLIHDRVKRIEFLRTLRAELADGAPVLIGYFTRPRSASFGFRYQPWIANTLRRLRRDRNLVELGDHLDPETPLFHHHFTYQEILSELHAAGFESVDAGESWFGHVVARASTTWSVRRGRSRTDDSPDCETLSPERETNSPTEREEEELAVIH